MIKVLVINFTSGVCNTHTHALLLCHRAVGSSEFFLSKELSLSLLERREIRGLQEKMF